MTESGAVSVIAAGLVAFVVFAGLLGLGAGRLLAAHGQAQLAADAAALAAAPATYAGGTPWVIAARLAGANGARLTSCRCPVDPTPVARTVWVAVAAEVDAGLLGIIEVEATAGAEFVP